MRKNKIRKIVVRLRLIGSGIICLAFLGCSTLTREDLRNFPETTPARPEFCVGVINDTKYDTLVNIINPNDNDPISRGEWVLENGKRLSLHASNANSNIPEPRYVTLVVTRIKNNETRTSVKDKDRYGTYKAPVKIGKIIRISEVLKN